jgi:hypothetical protein
MRGARELFSHRRAPAAPQETSWGPQETSGATEKRSEASEKRSGATQRRWRASEASSAASEARHSARDEAEAGARQPSPAAAALLRKNGEDGCAGGGGCSPLFVPEREKEEVQPKLSPQSRRPEDHEA